MNQIDSSLDVPNGLRKLLLGRTMHLKVLLSKFDHLHDTGGDLIYDGRFVVSLL